MYKTILFVILAFVAGMIISGTHASAGTFDFIAGNSVDKQDRPSGFARYFNAGDIMNECVWDLIAPDECRIGVLFDNQENMNQKINWLLEQHGYKFPDTVSNPVKDKVLHGK